MKKVKWQMKENFVFPSAIGMPTAAEEVNVTPRFTLEKVDDRPKLTGIYHLAVNVQLDTEKGIEPKDSELILIDDLDIDESVGYFEYAVPFNIDFPPEANDPVGIQTFNPHHEIDQNGTLSIIWDVECSYKEVFSQPTKSELEKHEALESTSQRTDVTAENQEEPEKSSKNILANLRKKKPKAAAEQETTEQKTEASIEPTAKVETEAKQEVAENQVQSDEQSNVAQSAEQANSVQSAAEEVNKGQELVKNKSNIVVETATFSEGDEVLSFLSELDDEISTTSFKLNDILVQAKS